MQAGNGLPARLLSMSSKKDLFRSTDPSTPSAPSSPAPPTHTRDASSEREPLTGRSQRGVSERSEYMSDVEGIYCFSQQRLEYEPDEPPPIVYLRCELHGHENFFLADLCCCNCEHFSIMHCHAI